MIYPVYSVRDRLTGFTGLVPDHNEESAKRSFAANLNSSALQSFQPGDFDLYYVADFDSDTGVVTPVNPIQLVIAGYNAVNVKSKE